MTLGTKPLPSAPVKPAVSGDVTVTGQPIPAITRLRVVSPGEWEEMILEWAHSLTQCYALVEKCAGAGDMGRDIIAHVSHDPGSPWDNYQCKHYGHALHPVDVWVEIGKLCYFTFKKSYSVPRHYYFVAPLGVGNTLSSLLRNAAELKARFLGQWDAHCAKGITKGGDVVLDDALKAHIDALDFSIFKYLPPLDFVDQYRETPYFSVRFGGGLPLRAKAAEPPGALAPTESVYVRALLEAYEERMGATLASWEDLKDELAGHFSRSRREFYSAESLREFSRDNVPEGTFAALQDEFESGIADVVAAAHQDGYARVLAVVAQAKQVHPGGNALVPRVTTSDKGGICHQLANDGRVRWCK
jgi:hypothetical protein